jgi:UDP-glucose 4-epimerase
MVETIHMDLCDIDEYGKLHAIKSDSVIHLAGQSLSSKSIEDPSKDLESNVIGTINLLQWCKDNNVRKFVYASTMRVYGDHDKPLHEEMPCAPDSFYGVTKYAAEHYVRLYAGSKLDTVIFRLFNVYGSGGGVGNHPHGLVSSLFSALLRKEQMVPGDCFKILADINKISSKFNWLPRVTLSAGIKEMVVCIYMESL